MPPETNSTPDFIGVGAPRAATTWLHACLQEHPDVYVPPQKELNYFSTRTLFTTTNNLLSPQWYQSQIAGGKNCSIRGEISPSYLTDQKAAKRIFDMFPNTKILINLRNPIDALYSSYHLGSCFYNLGDTFEDYLATRPDCKKDFLYHELLQKYLEHFQREQIHITFFRSILLDSEKVLRDLYNFLGVQYHVPLCLNTTINNYNSCQSPLLRTMLESAKCKLDRYPPIEYCYKRVGLDRLGKRLAQMNCRKGEIPPMHLETRQVLLDYYQKPNEELATLLGVNLQHWNRDIVPS